VLDGGNLVTPTASAMAHISAPRLFRYGPSLQKEGSFAKKSDDEMSSRKSCELSQTSVCVLLSANWIYFYVAWRKLTTAWIALRSWRMHCWNTLLKL